MGLARDPPGQPEVGVLVDAHGYHYRTESAEIVQLWMDDVTGLHQRGLDVSEVCLAAEPVDRLEL